MTKAAAESNTSTTTTRKRFRGTVVSDKMQDTIVVSVQRYVKHPKYKKYYKRAKKYHVHDPGSTRKVGDAVTIEECRPISKTKHFVVVQSNER